MSEKYYKISEKELLRLIMRDIEYGILEAAGVDNWDSGGMVSEIFDEDCKAAGLSPDEDYGYETYTYEDLAKIDLKNYQEVK